MAAKKKAALLTAKREDFAQALIFGVVDKLGINIVERVSKLPIRQCIRSVIVCPINSLSKLPIRQCMIRCFT